MAAESLIDPKLAILVFILLVFGVIGGYMFYANKILISSGAYAHLEKRAKKKKENWYPD